MAILEIQFIQLKVLQRMAAFDAVPPVAEQHTAYIPKNCADFRQGWKDNMADRKSPAAET